MQSLQLLDTSLSYRNLEPIDSSSSISSQWSTSYSPLRNSPAPETPSHENCIPISGEYFFHPDTRPPTQRLYETYPACPPYNSTHYSPANYSFGYSHSYPLHMYPSPPTDMNETPRTDTSMEHQRQPNHSELYPKSEPELGVSGSQHWGSFPARSCQKSAENHFKCSSSISIKSEFFNLDSQAAIAVDNIDEEYERSRNRTRDSQFTISSFREALGIVDPKKASSKFLTSSDPPFRGSCHIPVLPPETVGAMGLGLTRSKQEEVLQAAKSLFSKRTRTLYQWLCPDASKTKLKATVTAAWDTLSEPEKHFYISQVLGRFGLQESSLMVNPQLDGIKGLPAENIQLSVQASICKTRAAIEDQEAVNALFESCDDAHSWTSFRRQKKQRTPRKTTPLENEKRKKRKYTRRNPVTRTLPARGSKRPTKAAMIAESNSNIFVRPSIVACSTSAPIENEDDDLPGEAEKYIAGDEEFWNNPLNPEELFPEISF